MATLGFIVWKINKHELSFIHNIVEYSIVGVILIFSLSNFFLIKMNISRRIRIKSRGLSEYKKKLLS